VNNHTQQELKDILVAELEELNALSKVATENAATVELDQAKVGRLSRMDALQQQAMQVEQLRLGQVRIKNIQAALQRMQKDDYGWCEKCGEEIPLARLKINPAATHCTGCQ